MTTEQTTPEESKKPNYILWGCLIIIVLGCIMSCCLLTLIGLPLFTDFDPLGLDIGERIEDVIPWEDFLDDPSLVPDVDEIFPDEGDSGYDEDSLEISPEPGVIEPLPSSGMMPLLPYSAEDFTASFSYPADWEVTEEDYRVTFSHPDGYTYLYVGEDIVDTGTSAAEVADNVLATVMEDAAEDTFELLESGPYNLPSGHDAYLSVFQFEDIEGYYYWAYDLEIVDGESNIFLFLEGDNPEEFMIYRAIFDEIATSFNR
jgi:hypothetical protein